MKSFVFSLIVLAGLSSQAQIFNCTQQEAQFIGTVSEVRIDPLDQNMVDCYYKIEFSHYSPSMVCPLDIDEAYRAELQDLSCKLKAGDQVSGVLVKKDDVLSID